MSQPYHSLIQELENNTRLVLLGDNIDEELCVLLTHKMEAQLEEIEKQANEKIDVYRRARNEPIADIAAIETAIEELVDEYKVRKEIMYKRLAHEHGERQAERVYNDLGVDDHLPMAYLEILHETWDVVELEEGAQVGEYNCGQVGDDLDEEPVVVASMV